MDRNEAIEIVREYYYPSSAKDLNEALETLIPELKESEDERIRKELIEQVIYIVPNDDEVDNEGNVLPTYQKRIDKYRAWLEKQGEQKLPEKVEPKFKVGDWVVNTITKEVEQVIELTGCEYICSGHLIISFNNQHLLKRWTIQDAKDGDVLASKDGNDILIFRSIEDNVSFSSYYNIAINGEHYWSKSSFIPATKEQRELLFQKMKEAGYKWDADKKELKKIEEKPTWSEEDEKMIEFWNLYYEHKVGDWPNKDVVENLEKFRDWLKFLKERVQSKQDLHPRYIEGKGIYVPIIDVVLNMQDEPEKMTWEQAKAIALSKEQMLVVLYYKDEINALLEKHGGQKLEGWHWTSTQSSGAPYAWGVDFDDSTVSLSPRTDGFSVRAFSAYHPES